MRIRARLFPVSLLIATIGATCTPNLTAHASPDHHASRQRSTTHQQLAAKLAEVLRHHGAQQLDYSIDDPSYGSFTHLPDQPTAPASNEKIFTATTLLQLAGPEFRYMTPVTATADLTTHTLQGDLVITGSGDPTLSRANLLDMAKTLHQQGLHHVTGHLIVDDTRYSKRTVVAGWKRKFVPDETGTVDAFTVDHNVWHGGKSFIQDPTLDNARLFRAQLKRRHITIGKAIEIGKAPPTVETLVRHHSAPLSSIVHATMTDSINFDAEMMFRESGAQFAGHGSPKTGLAAERSVASDLGVPVGTVHDGSGLSYSDRSTPAILQQWLIRLKSTPYYSSFYYSLPLSCRTGTLKYRMCGPNVAGQVRAKTGTLTHVSTLSGYVTSAAGNPITFSFLASGVTNFGKLYQRVGAAVALFRKKG